MNDQFDRRPYLTLRPRLTRSVGLCTPRDWVDLGAVGLTASGLPLRLVAHHLTIPAIRATGGDHVSSWAPIWMATTSLLLIIMALATLAAVLVAIIWFVAVAIVAGRRAGDYWQRRNEQVEPVGVEMLRTRFGAQAVIEHDPATGLSTAYGADGTELHTVGMRTDIRQ